MAIIWKLGSASACRIAGIDKQRFNEIVAAGTYPCAPEVKKGASRRFGEDDLVALFIFVRLVDDDMPIRAAGSLACDIRQKLRIKKEPEPAVTRIVTMRGTKGTYAESEISATPDLFTDEPVFYLRKFAIGNIRNVVRAAMNEELKG